jgi:elongation factor P
MSVRGEGRFGVFSTSILRGEAAVREAQPRPHPSAAQRRLIPVSGRSLAPPRPIFAPEIIDTMATTADIKNGMCINHNGGLWLIIEFLHVKPGKGAAFVRTKLRNLATGRVVDHTFNSGVKIDPVRIETREYQYLYKEENGYVFMNTDNYEQVTVEEHLINAPEFLKDGVVCLLQFHADEERVLSCELPAHVLVEVTYSEPGIKGDTATNTLKPATVDTGVEVRVPLFVDTGDWIKVDTRTKEYVERVKK